VFNRKLGQRIFLYAAFAAPIVYFSAAPVYRPLADGEALLRVALSHAGRLVGECRERTPEELARLPANMRAELVCPRERAPVRVRVEVDGQVCIDETHAPRGLAGDGAVMVYHRLPIGAGTHRIRVLVADGPNSEHFDYVREEFVPFVPGRLVTVDFDRKRGGVAFR
jgi:hypothetical protein